MSTVDPHIASDSGSRWPDRIRSLSLAWRHAKAVDQRRRILAELLPLVNAAVARYVRLHGESVGRVNAEDVRDIASEKSVAFLRNLESGGRELADLHDAQIRAYLSVLARNGLVDALRKSSRRAAVELPTRDLPGHPLAPETDGAEIMLRHREFLRTLCECVSTVTPRARRVWFLRVFLDMPTKAIASHPDVRMTPAAVDMMFSRTRKVVRDCMAAKEYNADDAPPGTFMALWELLDGEKMGSNGEDDDSGTPGR
jgi:RNA polymerase sigma factor (sigma-70 family)